MQRQPIRIFLRRAIAFASIQIALVAIVFLALASTDRLPAPRLAGNESFDAKLIFLRAHPDRLAARTLLAGSSLTLNDLVGTELERELPDVAPVLNVGTWDERIRETRGRVHELERWTQPRTIIVVTAPPVFTAGDAPRPFPDAARVTEVLRGRSLLTAYLRAPGPRHYLREALVGGVRNSGDPFLSVDFDRTGSVMLRTPYPPVNLERWNGQPASLHLDPAEYAALAEFADELAREGRQLICIEAPIRADRAKELRDFLMAHRQRLEEVRAAHPFSYLPIPEEVSFEVDEFADWLHLNERGARRFTQAIADELRSHVTP